MFNRNSAFHFLSYKPAMAVAVLLAAEVVLFFGIPTKEYIPSPPPLELFARSVGPWTMSELFPIDNDYARILKADDTLTRNYTGPGRDEVFVAFFKSQRAGVTPHSPKMCLPANGWAEESSRIVSVNVPGEAAPIPVNRYIVARNEDRRLVLYFFQSWHRATADEYISKFYMLYDSVRYRRSDEALFRVVTDLAGTNPQQA